jgi:hypothetical protein
MTITVNTPDGGTAQFPDGTPTSTMTSALQAKFGWPSASSDNDYSKSPLSAVARTFESSADWGVGDLLRAAATGKKPSETAAQSSAAAASLPWYIRYPTEAAGYGLGLVNLLDPVTDAAEAGAAALGAGSTLSKIAGTAAEGATVGGVSHVAGSDDPTLAGTAGAALGGAALGGAAGAAAPLVNKGLTKVLGKPGSVDPAAANAATEANKIAKYADLHASTAPTFAPKDLSDAYVSSINDLTDVQKGDVSTGFMNKMQDHVNQMQRTGPVSAGAVDEYARSIQDAASPTNNAEQVLAAKVRDALTGEDGVLATAQPTSDHPVGQAYSMLKDAQNANKQWQASQYLGELQRQLKETGGSVGQGPFTEAEKYYTPGTPDYQAMAGLSGAGASDHGVSWMIPHLLGTGLSFAGEHLFGIPGAMAGELAGYMGGKKLIKSYNARRGMANIQQAYPQLTGQQPTGAQTGPQIPETAGGYNVGNAIKNLMLGSAY